MQKCRNLAALVTLVALAGPSAAASLVERVTALEVGLPLLVDANDAVVGLVVGGTRVTVAAVMEIDGDVYGVRVSRNQIHIDSGVIPYFENADCTGQAYLDIASGVHDLLSAHLGFVARPGKTLYMGDRDTPTVTIQYGSFYPENGCVAVSGSLDAIPIDPVVDLEVLFSAPFDVKLDLPD